LIEIFAGTSSEFRDQIFRLSKNFRKLLGENLSLLPVHRSFLIRRSKLSLSQEDVSFIHSILFSTNLEDTFYSEKDETYQDFEKVVSNQKTVLILCQTDKTTFGLIITDPVEFEWYGRYNY
jgi:hypothetical protein